MTQQDIVTPRGTIKVGPNGKAGLEWNTNFAPKWGKKFKAVQVYVDSEVLRLSEPMVPLRTGMLVMSGILGTVPGEGKVKYIAPYAKAQYYSKRSIGSQTGPLRGPYWFQRMKETFKGVILAGAKKIMKNEAGK
jgi:hypothetical protein